jgi:acetyltransferase-like isoleucine patch superfamily enzyme
MLRQISLSGCRFYLGHILELAFVVSDCKVQSHTFISERVTIEDQAFVNHGVMLINDRSPESTIETGRLQTEADWQVIPTVIKKRASVGYNGTILRGITIGENAVIGCRKRRSRKRLSQTL